MTVCRSLSNATKANFKYHNTPNQDFRGLLPNEWDQNLAFDKGKSLLDGLLNLTFLGDYSYRRFIGYLLRGQDDFKDPFQLSKFRRKDIDWKPILAKLLGFNDQLIVSLYEKKELLQELNNKQKILSLEAQSLSDIKTISDVEGEMDIVASKISNIESQLSLLNFGEQDKKYIAELVDLINDKIKDCNDQLFYARNSESRILKSLENADILFNPDDASKLFEEAGIIFDGQIKREFVDLIQFHKVITNERSAYLNKELADIREYIKELNRSLSSLNKEKAEKLSFLNDQDVFNKYKALSKESVNLKTKLASLEKIKDIVLERDKLNAKIIELTQECQSIVLNIRSDVSSKVQGNSIFSTVRKYFGEIIQSTLNKSAYITVNVNTEGSLIFEYKFSDTQEHRGHTYKKLLCIAFDMALARTYCEQGYPLFLFHDGIFESLDNRVKERLLNVVRNYSNYGLQQIITLIDSEIPNGVAKSFIADDEIILTLHDKDDSGRLFKIPEW